MRVWPAILGGTLLALVCGFGALLATWLFKAFAWKKLWGAVGGLLLLISVLSLVISVDKD